VPARVLGEHRRQQGGRSSLARHLKQRSALTEQPQVEIRQPRIVLQQEPGAIGQADLLEIAPCFPTGHHRWHRRGGRLRAERHRRQTRVGQIRAQHAAQLRAGDVAQAVEIVARKTEIAHDHFRRAEARGLARHRFSSVDLADDHLTDRLLDLRRREPALSAPRQHTMDRSRGLLPFRGFTGE